MRKNLFLKTRLDIFPTGCMQPEALINLPAKTGFMDRHIMLDPLDIEPYFKNRRNPPDDVIKLEEILNAVYQAHNSGSKEYTMDDSA